MIGQALQDAISYAVETGELSFLHAHFSDDVELRIEMAVGPIISTSQGKASAIDRLQNFGKVVVAPYDEVPEINANGDRVVACWDETVFLRSGLALGVQCALVFDVRDGSIVRVAIHHDLVPVRASGLRPRRQELASASSFVTQ